MTNNQDTLLQPIAVFDAGIGSYSIVELLKKTYPNQDIIYLADRNQFPYGQKSIDDLKTVIKETIHYLEKWNPRLIIVASNVPTITILNDMKDDFDTEIIGVYPPVKEALEKSSSKQIGILGVQSLIESDALNEFISNEVSSGHVYQFNASSLVELVEDGSFISDKYRTLMTVKNFMDDIIDQHEEIDIFTLSSTHLPWLYSYFKELYPHIMFIDPAETVIEQAASYISNGHGRIKTLVTENDDYTIEGFDSILEKLNIDLDIEKVEIN
ncbi:hypothetical protein K2V62_03205 [Mammaliicoccus sciuri]|uniref:glutamate racemase n=1 Tax=Mammaliicoccus sciuri TaxID=1296 RepID=UPI001E4917A6|nr:hypothetical protein [Mammaliicoccus sciuri]MCD8893690.1 hypothetical protein [Mammaliicoccus sciuri]MCD8911879.1 hypothetical protein [Mammaliicoccus sciuri]